MDETPNYLTPEVTGTVHVVVQTNEGVVMVSDSRSSAGSFASNPYSNKIWQVAPRVFFGRCGTTSHTQELTRITRYALKVLEVNADTPHRHAVKTASEFVCQVVQNNKKFLSGIIIAGGWDPEGGYQVYEISQSGMLVRRKLAVTGSGSAFIMTLIDSQYREDFTLEQATEFAVKAVAYAMVRDGSCGGVINICQITEKEVVRKTIRAEDMPVTEADIKT